LLNTFLFGDQPLIEIVFTSLFFYYIDLLDKVLNRGFIGTIDYGNGTAAVDSNGSRQNIQLRLVYSFGSKFGKRKEDRNRTQEEGRIRDEN